ncbi:MAG: O-antigen ligase family protein [Candidatus Ratteibacteria bacterium]|nr:O-antigen ligase family protein [Candidatus Ratteibacteria bacterium]
MINAIKKEKTLSVLDRIIGIFLTIIIFTIPFPKHIQTTETISFVCIILAFAAKLVLSGNRTASKNENELMPEKIIGTRIDLQILIFTIFVVISIFFSVNYPYSLHAFKEYWLKPLLLLYIIVNFAIDEKRISYLVWALIVISSVPVVLGIIQYFTEGIRLKSLFGAATEFGQYLDYIIPLIFAIVIWDGTKNTKISLGFILVAAFFCLIFTYTRASWISVFIAVMFLCFLKNKKLILIPIILILFFVMVSPHKIIDRIVRATDEKTYLKRVYLWESSINQIIKKPFTGYGWGYKNFYELYPSFVSPKLKNLRINDMHRYHTHNYLLQIGFETGIMGSIVFLWLWLTIMVLTWKNFVKLKTPFLKSVMGGIFASFIACSIHWIVEVPDAKQLIMMLWTFIGIAMGIVNITEGKWQKNL